MIHKSQGRNIPAYAMFDGEDGYEVLLKEPKNDMSYPVADIQIVGDKGTVFYHNKGSKPKGWSITLPTGDTIPLIPEYMPEDNTDILTNT